MQAQEQYTKFLVGQEVLLDLQTPGALHQAEIPLTWRPMKPPLRELRVWILIVMRRFTIRCSALCIVVNHECTVVLLHSSRIVYSHGAKRVWKKGLRAWITQDFNLSTKRVSRLYGNRPGKLDSITANSLVDSCWVYSVSCGTLFPNTSNKHLGPDSCSLVNLYILLFLFFIFLLLCPKFETWWEWNRPLYSRSVLKN
jgi:hypothetical protein